MFPEVDAALLKAVEGMQRARVPLTRESMAVKAALSKEALAALGDISNAERAGLECFHSKKFIKNFVLRACLRSVRLRGAASFVDRKSVTGDIRRL